MLSRIFCNTKLYCKDENFATQKGKKMRKSNAGRKTIDEHPRNTNITIRFTDEEIEEIEKIAKDMDIPKTRLIRNLVLTSLNDAKVLNKIGVLKGVKKFIDFKERFKHPEKYQTLQEA